MQSTIGVERNGRRALRVPVPTRCARPSLHTARTDVRSFPIFVSSRGVRTRKRTETEPVFDCGQEYCAPSIKVRATVQKRMIRPSRPEMIDLSFCGTSYMNTVSISYSILRLYSAVNNRNDRSPYDIMQCLHVSEEGIRYPHLFSVRPDHTIILNADTTVTAWTIPPSTPVYAGDTMRPTLFVYVRVPSFVHAVMT